MDLDPDYCLEKTNKKFIDRFNQLEKKLQIDNKNFDNVSLLELNEYWEKTKDSIS